MKELIHLQTITDLHKLFNLGNCYHPLVTVLDFSKFTEQVEQNLKITTDFYSIMFKNYCKSHIKYERKILDFQDRNLICIAPNQTIEIDNKIEDREDMEDKLGWGLFFHPDLIRSTSLNGKMKNYIFFHYDVSETLHLSYKEINFLMESVKNIETELQENIDIHSQNIIVSTIELLLNYCTRFYGRQQVSRIRTYKPINSQIENILTQYYSKNKINKQGLPTVNFLAESFHLSPSYLSDLLKKETGKNAQEYIHFYLIEEAKNLLLNTDMNVNEIAHNLGFEYPQYFNKLFNKKTSKTPMKYRKFN